MIHVAVTGAAGRMGKAIVKAIAANQFTRLSGALEREDSMLLNKDAGDVAGGERAGVRITPDVSTAFKNADVIIDFSVPECAMHVLDEAVKLKKPVVMGTTGFSHHQRDAIKEVSLKLPIVISPNMSIGVNLLFKLAQMTSEILGRDYDIEIIEAHHRHKKDAPSGTAVRLAEVVAAALNRDIEKVAVYERKGIIGERTPDEIGIQSIRAGDIVGDHTVMFAAMGERIELTHRASSRETFAAGAVRAAVWVHEKQPGLYDMLDVLGLKG